MDEIDKARKGHLFRIVFDILMEHPDGLPESATMRLLPERVSLTAYELEAHGSRRPRYWSSLKLASVEFARAGWLDKIEGKGWVVTASGRRAYQTHTDPETFFKEAINRRLSFQHATSLKAARRARDELREYLRSLEPPHVFQDLVADLLHAMGYYIAWKAKPGPDGGTDIIAWGDPLGVRSPRIRVQVKRQTPKVDVGELREFLAVLGDGEFGLYVATTSFTKAADDAARVEQRRQVTLINVDRFIDLWVEHYPKLDDAARRRFPLQPIYFLAPGN